MFYDVLQIETKSDVADECGSTSENVDDLCGSDGIEGGG